MPLLLPRAHGPPTGYFTLNHESMQAQGLVGWWPTQGQSGNVLRDYVRGQYTSNFPAAPAAPAWQPDAVHGSVLRFDGSNNYVSFGNVLNIGLSDFSWSIWFRRAATTANQFYGVMGKTHAGGLVGRWATYFDSGSIVSFVDMGAASATVSVAETNYLAGWHHALTTADRDGNLSLYMDGVPAGSADMSAGVAVNLTNADLAGIGAYPGYVEGAPFMLGWFPGDLATPAVWYRCLSAAEAWQMAYPPGMWDLYKPEPRAFPWYVAAPPAGNPLLMMQQQYSLTGGMK